MKQRVWATMTCGSHLLDTRETVDDESYLRLINNIPNPGLAQQYTYSALGVTNSPYKRRGPPRGESLLLRDSPVIRLLLRDSADSRNNHYSFGTRHIHSVLIIKSPVKLHPEVANTRYALKWLDRSFHIRVPTFRGVLRPTTSIARATHIHRIQQ